MSDASPGEPILGDPGPIADAGPLGEVATGSAAATPTGRLGLPTASALYVAAVLGTGALVLPGLAAQAAGPGSIIAVAAVLTLSIPLAGAFAALAARHPDAGGVATFVQRAFGPTAARVTGYLFFFGVAVGAPVVAALGGEYLAGVLGLDRAGVVIAGAAFLAVPFALAMFGLEISGRAQLGISVLLVAVVVVVVVTAVPAYRPEQFEPLLPHGWAGVGVAISLFIWAFSGWEAVTHLAGEFRDPRRTIPRATAIAVAVVGAAYLGLQIVTVGVLGDASTAATTPLLALVSTTLPGIGPALVTGIAAIIVLGVLNAYLPAFANLGAALGRDGHLPRWMARGAEPGRVPRRALAVVGVEMLVVTALYFALDLDLAQFVLLNTTAVAAVYALGMLAALRLLPRFGAGWWMALAALVLIAGLLVLAGPYLLWAALIAAVAVAVTVIRSWASRRTRRAAERIEVADR